MNIVKKLFNSVVYSIQGFKHAFRDELSFRLETFGLIVLIVVLIFLPNEVAREVEIWKRVFLLTSYLLIMLCELINSGLEKIADHLSPNRSEFAGKVKDLGSGAVFIAVIIHGMVWVFIGLDLVKFFQS